MMRRTLGSLLVGLVACTTNVNTTPSPGTPPPPEPTPVVAAPVEPTPVVAEPAPGKAAAVTVQMTAATLADDCGGPPTRAAESALKGKAKERSAKAKADRSCQQSSMQLSVVAAPDGAPTRLAVKKVELFDDAGKKLAELTARTPSVWDQNGTYQAWDQSITPGQDLSVSYALSEPPWHEVPDRRSRGYVLKAALAVGDTEQAVQRDVQVEAPTILPPGVKT